LTIFKVSNKVDNIQSFQQRYRSLYKTSENFSILRIKAHYHENRNCCVSLLWLDPHPDRSLSNLLPIPPFLPSLKNVTTVIN
jgi:hypothetical protein